MGVKTYYLLSNEHGNFLGIRAYMWLKDRYAAMVKSRPSQAAAFC